jgi:hypothetical protein
MSLPLKDFRVPIPESTHMWIEAEAEAFGLDMAAVARGVLKDWARRKARAYKVATKKLTANGMQPELFGADEEDDGMATASGGTARNRR